MKNHNKKKTKLTSKARKKLLGERCRICRTTEDLSINHIIPISAGGTDDSENLETLCRKCNSKEYNDIIKESLVLYFRHNSQGEKIRTLKNEIRFNIEKERAYSRQMDNILEMYGEKIRLMREGYKLLEIKKE